MPFLLTKVQKTGLMYQNNSLNLTKVRWDISDLPYVQNKEYQYYVSHLIIWRSS